MTGSSTKPDFRFPRSSRLLKHADFDRVYRQGRRHFSRNMTVFYLQRETSAKDGAKLENDLPSGPRVGFTVGRALGGSVVRNRIRRRLREAVRLNFGELQAPVDVVINPKKSALQAEFTQLTSEVAQAFRTVGRSSPSKAMAEREG